MPKVFDKVCVICSSPFRTPVHNKMICSKVCKNKYRVIWNREHRPEKEKRYGLCPVCGKKVELNKKALVKCCSVECSKESVRISHEKYKKINKDKINERAKIYNNSTKRKEWLKNHEEKLSIWRKEYNKKIRHIAKEYCFEKYHNNLQYRLGISLRGYIRRAIVRKQLRTNEYIEYTIPELIKKIESMFLPGMSWGNYGEWHIDHIRPLISFDFYNKDGSENIKEIKKAMSLDNLQPLWARDNIAKGGRYDMPTEDLA